MGSGARGGARAFQANPVALSDAADGAGDPVRSRSSRGMRVPIDVRAPKQFVLADGAPVQIRLPDCSCGSERHLTN